MLRLNVKIMVVATLFIISPVAKAQVRGMLIHQGDGTRIELQTSNVDSITFSDCVDYDGNIYETVQIGDQLWMAENLKVTHFRDGTPITNASDGNAWSNLQSEAYCRYNNNASDEVDTYGILYNWYAATDAHNIAPVGWHVPTDDEWWTLTTYLSGYEVAGGKMKEIGTEHWNSPNTSATNQSGYSALPGGYRDLEGVFREMGSHAYFWSATENGRSAYSRMLEYNSAYVSTLSQADCRSGRSLRLVRDSSEASGGPPY